MENWSKVDIENWHRREHYRYYTQVLKIAFNMTANINVSRLLLFCHQTGTKFYPAFIYAVTKTFNGLENFRMFINEKGELCVWDKLIPNYTVFHEDDKTFSDCWSYYYDDFDLFYKTITDDMKSYGVNKGISARANLPANFYCVSCAPWTAFIGYSSRTTNFDPQFFPIVTAGKYEGSGDSILMPVNIEIAHAVCDGYHAGLFFTRLQEEIDKLVKEN